MSAYNYDRLTALDNTFLVIEAADPATPMHVASIAIFDGAPLRGPDGHLDIDRITAHIESRLHRIPRYRQRLAYIPFEQRPVWVDDAAFNILYHVRHTALPGPGDERMLKRLSARIMSQALDRGKPLWEAWVVEGLEGGRVAMINKTHHCMIDGISGTDLLASLLDDDPNAVDDPTPDWIPRPVPSAGTLLRDELLLRAAGPLGLAGRILSEPRALLQDIGGWIGALRETASDGMHLASDTPFNQPVGPHRRFDWMTMEIADIRAIRERLGGSLNDVVLATVAGAVGRYLERRGVRAKGLDFRVFVPVSVRTEDEKGKFGNRVAGWMVDLPIAETDPRKRISKVQKTTAKLKRSGQAKGSELLMEAAEWTGTTLLTLAVQLGALASPVNMVVTNVPGPAAPLYLLGARMLECFPMVPLGMNMGLGIALLSNNGRIFWGFNADWDQFPDLHDFVVAIRDAFEELKTAPGQN